MNQNQGRQFCGTCSAEVAPNAAFCGGCGTPRRALAAAIAPNAVASPALTPVYAGAPGFAQATQAHVNASFPHKSAASAPWLIIGGAVILGAIVLGIVAYLLRPQPENCVAPCAPPTSPPLSAPHRFTSSAFGYSLDWYDMAQATVVQRAADDKSIGFTLQENSNFQWTFSAEPANGRTAQQIVEAFHQSAFSTATPVFPVAGAEVGYTPGSGTVYDLRVTPANGQEVHLRAFVISAIKNGLAVNMVAVGPFKDQNYGHANPSQSPAPFFFGAPLNTVRWKGDPEM